MTKTTKWRVSHQRDSDQLVIQPSQCSAEVMCTQQVAKTNVPSSTVNHEILTRVLFSRNFAFAKFREHKILEKWRNHSVVY